jgi:hypothetical protein
VFPTRRIRPPPDGLADRWGLDILDTDLPRRAFYHLMRG